MTPSSVVLFGLSFGLHPLRGPGSVRVLVAHEPAQSVEDGLLRALRRSAAATVLRAAAELPRAEGRGLARAVVSAFADADRGAARRSARGQVVERGRIAAVEVQVLLHLSGRDVHVLLEADELGLLVLRDGLAVDDLGGLDEFLLRVVAGLRHRDLGALLFLLLLLVLDVPDGRARDEDRVQSDGHEHPRRIPRQGHRVEALHEYAPSWTGSLQAA